MKRWKHNETPKRNLLGSKAIPRPRRSWRAKLLMLFFSAVCLTSLGLLAFPYLPHLSFLFHRHVLDDAPYKTAAATTREMGSSKDENANRSNRLILPAIGVNAQLIEGSDINVIGKNQGVWHETPSANPTKPGNIVIAGHRFLYTATNGGYFYNLPELQSGNKIYLGWNGGMYEYEVYATRTVLPTQTDVRDPDPAVPYKLTMYTCYPLGSTAKRFVIEAKQIR